MVSVIILSYNTEELLRDCLTSVFTHLKGIPFEIIVVDNASSDGSTTMVEKEFPRVKLLKNIENSGFAKGCNIGAAAAKGEFLLFLNSDVEISDEAVPELLKTAEIHDAGIVGGTLRNTDGTDQRSYGQFYSLMNIVRLLFGGEKAELKHYRMRKTGRVDWVTGGFMLFRRDDFLRLKGFDEHFFMYMEDVEICYRAFKTGITVYCNPTIVVRHIGHGSSNKTFAVVHIYKGLQYFYKKHQNPVQYYVVKCILFLKAMLSLLVGYLTGNRYLKDTYKQAFATL